MDILKEGGMVTPCYSDKIFRMHYDNRRVIDDKLVIDRLLDSKPSTNVESARLYRFVGKLPTAMSYNKTLSSREVSNKYNNVLDIAVRSFIRGLFNKDYNLDISAFKDYKEVVEFVTKFDNSIKLTVNTVASLKRRPLNKRRILASNETVVNFLKYVKIKFPDFDNVGFLGN